MVNVEYCSCEKRSRSNQRQSACRLDTHATTVNRIENSIECRRILAGISSSPELSVPVYEKEGERVYVWVRVFCGYYKLFRAMQIRHLSFKLCSSRMFRLLLRALIYFAKTFAFVDDKICLDDESYANKWSNIISHVCMSHFSMIHW